MRSLVKITLSGCGLILVFDVLASLASREFGFPYVAATPGSLLIYAAAGFVAGRAHGVPQAAGVGALVGEVESTIGWWLSFVIGAIQPESATTSQEIASVIVAIIVVGGMAGAAGGWLGRRFAPRPTRELT